MQVGLITDSLGSRPLDEVLDITAESASIPSRSRRATGLNRPMRASRS